MGWWLPWLRVPFLGQAPNLSGHHQLQPQNYFAVADNNDNNNSGIDDYPYYQDHQHGGGGGSFAAGNAMANVPVAQDYGQDAWMGGMNSGSIVAAVASGAGVMPVHTSSSSSSSQSFQPMAMSQYHGPATADGLPYEPSPLSTPCSHTMQSPWSPEWDGVQGPVVVDALGRGPSASSSSTSAVAVLSPVAQHASNEHGSPAHHRVSPGGGDRRGSRSIAPGPSGHPRTPHMEYHQQAYGYPGGHLAAAAACDAMDAYAPDGHAMGDVVQSPARGLTQGSGSVVAPGRSVQQRHVASSHHGAVALPQAAGGPSPPPRSHAVVFVAPRPASKLDLPDRHRP
ncbi:hypothetical protein MAPG_11396 [Magnaporthiopsis poae ATCC 64411]|uniref:Uncharacterized protein n=1 Tax=Magnaporthiopsis poae (strain ATCC 64411 / 73-15) TaxID=644358 RepID=A0A0C4EF62_MAGP6|nr:hypothetical protein MAPG_11396 [Magnaporthiopsis poae ATCC 64411]